MRRSRTVEGCRVSQDSYPYLTPPIPARAVLMDMILWYTTAEMRREWMASWELEDTELDRLTDQTTDLIASWRPTTPYQVSVARAGRVVEWLVWQVALSADQTWASVYLDVDMFEPWAIQLDTLPRYGLPPTAFHVPD
jgi:hypothetical protein